jgi:hypothetical protein
MPIIFTQTDNTGVTEAAFCSGLSANGANGTRQATDGGSAGVTGVSVVINGSAATLRFFYFTLPVAAGINWNSGNWTVRINVTTGAANCTWETCHICRVNSSDVNQATIGSATGLGIAISGTGAQSTTFSGAAQTPGVGDKVVIVLGVSNSNSCTRTSGITPDQNIDSPFEPSGTPSVAIIGAHFG